MACSNGFVDCSYTIAKRCINGTGAVSMQYSYIHCSMNGPLLTSVTCSDLTTDAPPLTLTHGRPLDSSAFSTRFRSSLLLAKDLTMLKCGGYLSQFHETQTTTMCTSWRQTYINRDSVVHRHKLTAFADNDVISCSYIVPTTLQTKWNNSTITTPQ